MEMSHRADEIRKRIAKRKREKGSSNDNEMSNRTSLFLSDEEKYSVYSPPTFEGGPTMERESILFFVQKYLCLNYYFQQ